MSISMREKIIEAIMRMKTLGIFEPVIEQFQNEGLVNISEPPFGAFYWADEDDLEHIKKFEEEYNALVYMIVRSYTKIGQMDSMLFVSDYPEEWEMDHRDLSDRQNWQQVAYVYNHDVPEFSEIGAIGLAPTQAEGLLRTW